MSAPEVWGLTGAIASGKSSVAKVFAEVGFPVLDADQIARELSSPGGKAYPKIVERFGTAEPAELRKIVFADARARRDLEDILHSLIRSESEAKIQALAKTASKNQMIYEAALLVETGKYKDFAGLIVVEADPEIRKMRLIKSKGLSEEMIRKIFESQISDEKRREVATAVFQNNGSFEDLRTQVKQFILDRGW